MMSDLKIAAITACHNRLEMTRRFIESARAQTRPLDAIVVVDGDSTDGTREWLTGQADVAALFVRNEGSAGGMRRGLEWAYAHGCDWFWLLDNDIVISPDALAQLCAALEKRPIMRVLNSLCVGEQDRTHPAAGALCWRENPNDFLHGHNLFTVDDIRAHVDADGFLDTVGGQLYQGTLIHRSVVEEIGTPLTQLFTRGDEVEYGLRMMRAGFHIYSYPVSVVTHPDTRIVFLSLWGQRFPCEEVVPFKRYYNVRNSIYIRKEYYAGKRLPAYVARRVAGSIFSDVILYRNKNWRERFASLRAILRGAWDGLWFRAELPLVASPAHIGA